ncbi:MAG: hypothetical protein ABEJ68_08155 [Halobacteriaceae archaeon]
MAPAVTDLIPRVLYDFEALGTAAVLVALLTLTVGRSLAGALPERTARVTARVQVSPGWSFLYGTVVVVATSAFSVLLFFTFIGFPAAIALAVALVLAIAVGAAVAYVAFAQALTPTAVGRRVALLLGAVLAGTVTLVPVVGGLTTLAFGVAGFGAMFAALYDR